jgi:hypothetical protein
LAPTVSTPTPNPQPCPPPLSLDAAARLRHLDCRRYSRCLDTALAENWLSFTCVRCDAFEPAPRQPVEPRRASALGVEGDRRGRHADPSHRGKQRPRGENRRNGHG